MKCRLLIDCWGPGPDWGVKAADGKTIYDEVVKPAGLIIDDPAAWRLCFGVDRWPDGQIQAEPADEECETRVKLQKERLRLIKLSQAQAVEKAREQRDREEVDRAKRDTEDFGEFLDLSDDEFNQTVKEISDGD